MIIHALVLMNLLKLLRKIDKMLGKPPISSLFPSSFDKFNQTCSLMLDPLCIVFQSCGIQGLPYPPDLGPHCLQRLSADDTNRQRVKARPKKKITIWH